MNLFSPHPDSRIRNLQVETINKYSKTVFLTNYINAAFVVLIMWTSSLPKEYLIIWFVAMYALTTVRLVLSLKYWKDEERIKHADSWARTFMLTTAASGLLWGLGGAFFYMPDAGIYEAFILILVLGIGAGGMAFMSPHRPTFFLFFTFLIFPVIIRVALVGDLPHFVIAGMVSVYWGVFMVFGTKINDIILEGMLLRFDNLELVDNLIEEKEAAEKANIAKSKFLAAASHDLRQPLHALTLLSGALAERIQYQEVKDIVVKIRGAVSALENLFNALLDISKLDSGVLQPCVETFHLKTIFERLDNDFRPEAEEKGLSFEVKNCKNVIVESDDILLERILRNFISNAIRYTPKGSVVLQCEPIDGYLEISIIDSGIGIPEGMQTAIFDEYIQLDNPERNRNKGLGLGLAIVSRIAKLLHHQINIISQEGQGSIFCVTVPYRPDLNLPIPAAPPPPEFTNDLKGLIVLVIDDEVSILEALTVLLTGWGCKVIVAESVEQARQALRKTMVIPNAIISDYRLREGINGVETIKAIEAMVGQEIPAILITGDMEISTGDGISEAYRVLHKPVQPARVRAFLKHVRDGADRTENEEEQPDVKDSVNG
jgi:signal transduction histidine kinase/CheY-like chemotaxis protein